MNVVIEFAEETQEREKLLKEVKEIMIRECLSQKEFWLQTYSEQFPYRDLNNKSSPYVY